MLVRVQLVCKDAVPSVICNLSETVAPLLADLDELVLTVRNPESRRNIEEAVKVLRAGSPRAAIMLTWLAVVYDVVGKLRELDESGDQQAKTLRMEFESIRAAGDVRRAQDFEANIPRYAHDLELVSTVEQQDLENLQRDRHRCAHPSQTEEGVRYAPSEELARSHLRTAIDCLLKYPPVQGMAALTRVQTEIDSPYFPDDETGALERLRASPIGRARHSLVRNVAVTLVKIILVDPLNEISQRRRRALGALWVIYPVMLDEIAAEKLVPLCAKVEDSQLRHLLFLVRALPRLLAALPSQTRDRLGRFVVSPPPAELAHVTMLALTVPELRKSALAHLSGFALDDYQWVMSTIGRQMPADLAAMLIDGHLTDAEDSVDEELITKLSWVGSHMSASQMRRFFDLLVKNGEPEVNHTIDLEPLISKLDPVVAEREFKASGADAHYPWEQILNPL